MSRYTSQYTGSEIDEAIGRALPNGVIDTALAEKAPAGYGLGGGAKFITSGSLNDYKNCGWYAWDENVNNTPFPYGSCIILNKGSSWIVHQIAIAGYGQSICIRKYFNQTDEWDAWEYINPPMQPGVEYRTTERYQGKPVYVKLIDFGALPNKTIKKVDPNITNFSKLVDMRIIIAMSDGSYHIENIWSDNGTNAISLSRAWFKLSTGGIAIYTFSDQSANSAIVTIKYTKTTD